MSESQIQGSAAGPVHDERQQDDGEDDDHQPEEEHDDSGDGVPGYRSRSSHGLQLPGAARLIRNGRAYNTPAWPGLGRTSPRQGADIGVDQVKQPRLMTT